MRHTLAFAAAGAALLATPLLAGPPAKRPTCQVPKGPARDAKRVEPCRRQAIPPIIDPSPMFLISTAAAPVALSDLS